MNSEGRVFRIDEVAQMFSVSTDDIRAKVREMEKSSLTLFHWKVESFLPGCDLVAMAEDVDHARRLLLEELERKERMDLCSVDFDLCRIAINNPPDEICYGADALVIPR